MFDFKLIGYATLLLTGAVVCCSEFGNTWAGFVGGGAQVFAALGFVLTIMEAIHHD